MLPSLMAPALSATPSFVFKEFWSFQEFRTLEELGSFEHLLCLKFRHCSTEHARTKCSSSNSGGHSSDIAHATKSMLVLLAMLGSEHRRTNSTKNSLTIRLRWIRWSRSESRR